MTLVPEEVIREVYRELHAAAYDVYEKHGPVLVDELGEFAPVAVRRLMPILEGLARDGLYRKVSSEGRR